MATRRRASGSPPIEIKHFTPDEIEQGITKLRRRIEQVQALAAENVAYDDQRVSNAEQDIHTTILEVFGQNSPQYERNGDHEIRHGSLYRDMPANELQEGFRVGVPRTIQMLEGLINGLEEKRVELGQSAITRVRAAFEGLDLHPRIAN
jgi:hypothetical protein